MSLPQWVEFFDELQNVRGRSLNTVMAYRRDLELYVAFKKTSSNIQAFYHFMKEQGLSERSQARVISSLRTYFKFCEDRGMKSPELRELKLPKVKNKLPDVLTKGEFDSLFESCKAEDPFRSARNQMTLLMLFGSGCRVSELIGLDLKDFNETESYLIITGKGNKQRAVPLTEHLKSELKIYLEQIRPKILKENTQSIFINDRGNRPSRVDIWRWLSSWSKKAGLKQAVSPHQFRHGCATALLESGADLRSIQLLLGHSSLQTTQIYTTVTSNKLAQTVEDHHPLSTIKDI
ncbi:MAG: tyrosine-type recombinase/integrase [Bdellovibrionota bacterium]